MEEKFGEDVINIEKYLRKVDFLIRRKGREILSDFDITVPQFSALQILIHHKNLTIGELSKKMSLACSTITDLIDRMEKSELVARKRDKSDKRVVKVEVLPKGHDILGKVLEKRVEYLNSNLSSFHGDEKHSLSVSLGNLYSAMKDE